KQPADHRQITGRSPSMSSITRPDQPPPTKRMRADGQVLAKARASPPVRLGNGPRRSGPCSHRSARYCRAASDDTPRGEPERRRSHTTRGDLRSPFVLWPHNDHSGRSRGTHTNSGTADHIGGSARGPNSWILSSFSAGSSVVPASSKATSKPRAWV